MVIIDKINHRGR